MTNFSQLSQPVRAVSTLGADALLLRGFRGSEAISRPFEFIVELQSEDARIDGEALLQAPLRLDIALADGAVRHIHGLVRSFVQLGRHESLVSYRAEIVPWFWFLQLGTDCRVFQGKSVLQIAQTIFREFGFTDYRLACSREYPEREYCVQYRESHFAFISRLLEEEGIAYYFSHEQDRHVMVLTDTPNGLSRAAPAAPVEFVVAESRAFDHDVVTLLERRHSVHPGRVTCRNYDPLQPSLTLEGSASNDRREEQFEYPVKFTKTSEGHRYARVRLEELECMRQTLAGAGNVRGFGAGQRFSLAGHYRSDFNQQYALVAVEHSCDVGDYQSGGTADISYANRFTAIPADVPYRPQRLTPRPVVQGSQPAQVVGPMGRRHEIDAHARVKIQFFWDRRGHRDEKSSCWVRVASPWASKGFGGVAHPRIGDEVVVDFFEGDPDQPIIVGRVYNAEHVPPYPLPAQADRTGLRSQSGNGYNEVMVDDADSGEGVTIHAQYNMGTRVNNDAKISIGNNLTQDVGVDATEQVGNNKTTVVTNASVTSADTIVFNAATSITLKCGASLLHMNQAGVISISGSMISMTGSVLCNVAAPVTSVAGGLVLAQTGTVNMSTGVINWITGSMKAHLGGAEAEVEASGTCAVKGSPVKLN